MRNERTRVTLIHHPTVALRVSGFTHPDFEEVAERGVYLGNVYRRIIPPSLPRVAALLEADPEVSVDILDLRISGADTEDVVRSVEWDGYRLSASRVGADFSEADAAIDGSDWIGLTSHFTFESGVVCAIIAHARRRKPAIRVMVGGADVAARPEVYLEAGADIVFGGDLDPEVFRLCRSRSRALWTRRSVAGHRHPFTALTRPDFSKLTRLSEYRDSHDGPVPDGVDFPIGFIYFTRGCPRECDFCESRRTAFEALDLRSSIEMLEHYRRSGIRTLDFADDNLLLLAGTPRGREATMELFACMRAMGFAWEFPNGLEIGRFVRRDGQLDEELMSAMFSHRRDPETGRLVGAFRLYIPLETFERRGDYRKLRPVEEQNRVIAWLAAAGLPEIDFGVVIPPDASPETFAGVREGYGEIQEIVRSRGHTRARYGVFHLIPIALHRTMATRYSAAEFPEGWNFYFPVYDGKHLSARELFEHRLRLMKDIDHENYVGMTRGQYGYS